ncbi:MAG: sigma-70 family RNA polymerase sigma factor [Pseudomonadota bacterium]
MAADKTATGTPCQCRSGAKEPAATLWTEWTDEALIAEIAAHQSKPALGELFKRYAGKIKAFLMRAGAAADIAEDATQDVMVTLWRKSGSFNPSRASAATWIYTIARNRRIDLLRRASRPEPSEDDPLFRPEPAESAETMIAGANRDAVVREAISALSEDQQAVIRMAFYSGLSHSEIADMLDCPLGTVKSRLRLGFAKIRETLGQDFAQELTET